MQQLRSRGHAVGIVTRFADSCKKLFFVTTVVALPLVSVPSVSNALPRNNPSLVQEKSPDVRKQPVPRDSRVSCRYKGGVLEYRLSDGKVKRVENLLERGEKIVDVACNESYAFVLTDTSVIMVPGLEKKEGKGSGNVTVAFLHTRKDLRDIFRKGLVAWANSEDRAYFLTRDRDLTEIPAIIKEKTIPVYQIPNVVGGSAMVFHSGFLFIAPVEVEHSKAMLLTAIRFEGGANFREIALPQGMDDGGFFFDGKKLVFGKRGGNELEIKVNGAKLDGVSLVKRKIK
jgi:hypothetical protein